MPQDLNKIKYFLLDMDGTIYLENTLLGGTLEFLDTLKKQNKRAIYITNNSSKAVTQYIEKLARLGINSTEEDFCTSANALVYYLNKAKPGAKIYLLGTPSLKSYMIQSGFKVIDEYITDKELRPDYVVLAYDTTLTYDKLVIACDYIKDEVKYVATHPDMVCPVGVGKSVPDAGSFMLLIEGATGKRPSLIAGKPNPCMINMVIEKMGCRKEEIAVVGDRLNTDIMSAINAGVTSVCVLTGETTKELLSSSEIKPDYVLNSIKDLYMAIK